MKHVLSASGAALLALALLAGPAFAGWWDEAVEPKVADLAEVIAHPHDWKGKEIRFTCVFHKVSEFYNPYFTQFAPGSYLNFAAWPAGAEIWREDVYAASHPFLFLARLHDFAAEMPALPRFTTIEVTGVVQDTFKNTPWIEVTDIEVRPDSVTQESLALIIRGDRAAEQGDREAALAHYRQAAGTPLPAEIRRNLAIKEAEALAGLGRVPEARQALAEALAASPDDPEIRKMLADLDGTPPDAAPAPPVAAPPPPVPAVRPPAPASPPPAVRATPAAARPHRTPEAPVEAAPPPAAAAPTPPAPIEAPEAVPAPKAEPAPAVPATPAAPAGPRKRITGPM